jgi:hypothetical protein
MVQCCLPRNEHRKNLACLVDAGHWAVRGYIFFDSLQALPHLISVRAGGVGFDLNPVLTICLLDGLSEVIAGLLFIYLKHFGRFYPIFFSSHFCDIQLRSCLINATPTGSGEAKVESSVL